MPGFFKKKKFFYYYLAREVTREFGRSISVNWDQASSVTFFYSWSLHYRRLLLPVSASHTCDDGQAIVNTRRNTNR